MQNGFESHKMISFLPFKKRIEIVSISVLPNELLLNIFSGLPPQALGRCSQVNREWNALIEQTRMLWVLASRHRSIPSWIQEGGVTEIKNFWKKRVITIDSLPLRIASLIRTAIAGQTYHVRIVHPRNSSCSMRILFSIDRGLSLEDMDPIVYLINMQKPQDTELDFFMNAILRGAPSPIYGRKVSIEISGNWPKDSFAMRGSMSLIADLFRRIQIRADQISFAENMQSPMGILAVCSRVISLVIPRVF